MEKIDLRKLLSEVAEGTTFWSDRYGDVRFIQFVRGYPRFKSEATGKEFPALLNGAIVSGGECDIFPSKDQRDWSKFCSMPNLRTLLRDVPIGTAFWSPVHGEMVYTGRDWPRIEFTRGRNTLLVYPDGKVSGYGEVVIFPSEYQRDWSKYDPSIPKGTPVMALVKDLWVAARYHDTESCNVGLEDFGAPKLIKPNEVIPVSEFDFVKHCRK